MVRWIAIYFIGTKKLTMGRNMQMIGNTATCTYTSQVKQEWKVRTHIIPTTLPGDFSIKCRWQLLLTIIMTAIRIGRKHLGNWHMQGWMVRNCSCWMREKLSMKDMDSAIRMKALEVSILKTEAHCYALLRLVMI